MANGIATASAAVESDPDVTPGEAVAIEMGLDNVTRRVFTGEVEEEGQDYYPAGISFPAVGPLHRARKRTNHVDTSWPGALPDPDLPTPPKYAYYAVGATDVEHVAALLELAGITEYDLSGTGDIVGEINPVILPTGGSPWALIQEIDRFTWHRTFDGPDGVVVRRPFSILPGSGAAMTLTEGVDLDKGQRVRSRGGMIANVHIVGTSYIGADDWPIVIEYATDNPAENEYGINDVLEYQSELFETEAQAEAWAATAMGEYGVLQVRYRWQLIRGFSDLRAGMTVAIVSPRFGLGEDSRFLVEAVRHFTDGTEYLTSIEVRGAAIPDATSANQKPVPVVVMNIRREWIDGEYVDTVGLDASGSYDPDGPAIGVFEWDGDPVVPIPIGSGQRATVSYPGGVEAQTPNPPTVTLTVTDLMGAEATRTFPVRATAAIPIQTRDVWAAVTSELLYSPDGGVSWQSFAVEAVGCVREVAGYQLAWESDGTFYKVVPGLAPILLTPTAITCAWVSYRVGEEFTGVCYAGGSDGKVWRSVDEGASWVEMGTLPAALTTISESPYMDGEVQATAGDKLYRSFDAGAVWAMLHEYGNPAMVAADFAAGFGKGLVGFSGADTSESRVQEREGAITVTFPAGHTDPDVRALTISGSENIFWVLATEAAGDGNSWQGDLVEGGELVEKDYDNAYGEPWDMIRDPKTEGLIYFIQNSQIAKTLDGFASVLQFLLLTGAQAGRKLGIGPLRAFALPAGDLVWVGTTPNNFTDTRWVYRLTSAGFSRVAHPLTGAGAGSSNVELIVTTSGALLTYASGGRTAVIDANAVHRSTDGGLTWSPVADLAACYLVQAGPDGVVYAATQSNFANPFAGHSLWRSDDNGATWAVVDTIGGSGVINTKYNAMDVNPNDPLDVLMKGYWNSGSSANQADNPRALDFHRSTDGGATWVHLGTDPNDQAGAGNGQFVSFTPSGDYFVWYAQESFTAPMRRAPYPGGGASSYVSVPRDSSLAWPSVIANGLIYMYGDMGVLVSDDEGASWSDVTDFATIGSVFGFVPSDSANAGYALRYSTGSVLYRQEPGTSTWLDISAGLAAAFPDGNYRPYTKSAVRLPGGA